MKAFARFTIATFAVILALQIAIQWGGVFQGAVTWRNPVSWLLFWTSLEFWRALRNADKP